MLVASGSYGPLKQIVAGGAAAVSAAAALGAWAGWDRFGLPDVGVTKTTKSGIGTVANAVGIVVLWNATRADRHHVGLPAFAVLMAGVSIVCFLVLFSALQAWTLRTSAVRPRSVVSATPILGGLRMRAGARAAIRAGETRQGYFEGVAYQPDDMWRPWSLVATKVIVLLLYFVTVLAGTLALAAAGRLLANG